MRSSPALKALWHVLAIVTLDDTSRATAKLPQRIGNINVDLYMISSVLTPHSTLSSTFKLSPWMTTIKLDSRILEQDADTIMEQLNIQSQQATVRTLQILFLRSSAQLEPIHYNPPIFLPQSQSIAPSYTDVAPRDVTYYLEKLVRAAQQTAESHCYGSFVAGQISESDEFGDVGIWLGEGNYQRNHEREILDKLGLIGWADAEIDQMENLYDEKLKVEGSETSAIGKLLDSLEDCHRFFVRRQDSYFACFLVGRLKAQRGWCGLASIGVAT